MYHAVLACCRWLENTPWGVTVRDSAWMGPVMQWVHFVGLSMWLGTSLGVDLRLMGVGERRLTAAELSNGLFAWNWIGFSVAFLGGFLLFSADATTYVSNTGFRLKLVVVTPLALIWHLVVQKKTRTWTQAGQTSAFGKWAGLIEFLLWISVVTAAVGFLLTNDALGRHATRPPVRAREQRLVDLAPGDGDRLGLR
jgi:hypothetical protein